MKCYAATGIGLALLALSAQTLASEPPRKPNVIFLLADDVGPEWFAAYGGTQEFTPNLDRFAREGAYFPYCYSAPLCTPSRVMLMTGKYGHRNYEHFAMFPVGEAKQTFGNIMKQAGYATCMAGKWQLGKVKPSEMGFDQYLQYNVNQGKSENYFWKPYDQDIHGRIKINGLELTTHDLKYGPDIVCKFITDFIEANKAKPFFVYHPMLHCHAPWQPTPDTRTADNFPGKAQGYTDMKFYPDNLRYMDKHAARIIAKVAELGLDKDTLVLFTGDNGSPHTKTEADGKSVRGGKGAYTDAGTHVPLIGYWPGTIRPGSVCRDLVDFTDFYATFADVAGVKAADRDGVSFLPQLRGEKGHPRDWAFLFYAADTAAGGNRLFKDGERLYGHYWARNQQWKLYEDGSLFDVASDPAEKRAIQAQSDTAHSAAARKKLEGAFAKLQVSPEDLKRVSAKAEAKFNTTKKD